MYPSLKRSAATVTARRSCATCAWPLRRLAAIATASILAACATANDPAPAAAPAAAGQTYAGWYMQRAGQGSFQPCGAARPLRVTSSADLPARARTFGLDENVPIHVRVTGVVSGSVIAISRVEQFGSPVPVRDCALTGVVVPQP